MISTLTHWLAAAWLALTRGPHLAWLHLELWELLAWLRDCQRDGLHHSLHLRACRDRAAELRTAIALLQPPPAAAAATRFAGRPDRAARAARGGIGRRPAPRRHAAPTEAA